MGMSERPAADLGVDTHHAWVHPIDVRAGLAVPELTDIVVALFPTSINVRGACPAEHGVGGRLGEALSFNDTPSVVCELALPEKRLENRGLGLFKLQKEGVVVAFAEKQDDPHACADAAHTNDLTSGVHVTEALEEEPAVMRKRTTIGAKDGADRLSNLVGLGGGDKLLDRDDQRRVADDPRLAVDEFRQPAERAQVVFGAPLCDVTLDLPAVSSSHLATPARCELIDLEARVPDIEGPRPCELEHRHPIGTCG